MPTPLVLVAGLHAGARTAAVDRLLRRHPGAVAIHHDIHLAAGRAERVVRDASGVLERARIRVARSRAARGVREDLRAQLALHAGSAPLVIADLWDSAEPRPVAEALAGAGPFRLTCVLTALDAAHTPLDLCRGDRLAETGREEATGDRRYLAEVLARQIEYAGALSLHGGDEEDIDLSAAVLRHLAPATPITADPPVTGPTLSVRALAERVDPATALLPAETRTGEITTVAWRRLRPLHPGRLFEAVDELVTTTVRSRGRFWLANRHERMLSWDAVAGVIDIRDAGPWLAALPGAAWDLATPTRRVAAALDWHPEVGDRVQHLVFTGPGLDRRRIHALLDSCLIDQGPAVPAPADWSGFDDPFAGVLTPPPPVKGW
ncbi:G3E family GTPase [Thermocatellispora tengchongensis]|uniref:G3E family GTPase n=1 Tax=Thermocatellispora tengchongensis TaxID=1073253 RepID=A0A840PI09_9ACTN|nr:GTP-binding protein [Thermocatellispora tengchongensis]MBB5137533.1 G3E family GTPase [Thermocatellispora tengchongensis]